MSSVTAPDKSLTTAYLLWFFLGGFGAHRFYMGRTGSAIGMLSLCLGSAVLSVFMIGLLGYPVLFIWWLVDAFLISKWADKSGPGMTETASPSQFQQAA